MASSLNHPHILTVYDAGESDGRQYLVTEFVDGGTLKDWASAKKRSWREVIDLLVEHRDVSMVGVLQNVVQKDDNSYVRLKCEKALKEMNASVGTF